MDVLICQIALAILFLIHLSVSVYIGGNTSYMRDHVAPPYSFNGLLLGLLLVGTLVTQHDLDIQVGQKYGLISMFPMLVSTAVTLLLGYFLLPKVIRWKQSRTLVDLMEHFYGKAGKYVSVGFSSLFCMVIVIAQISYFATFASLLGIDLISLLLFTGILVTTYSAAGGMRSIALLRLGQIALLAVALLACLIVAYAGLPSSLLEALQDKHADEHIGFWENAQPFSHAWGGKILFSMWPIWLMSPPVVQCILSAKRTTQIQTMMLSSTLMYALIRFALLFVGLSLFQKCASETIDLSHFLSHTMKQHSIYRMFALIGIAVVVLSTADLFLHALGVMWAQHMITSSQTDSLEERESTELKMNRLFVGCFGLLATLISFVGVLMKWNLTAYELLHAAQIVFGALFLPFIAGIWGIKGNPKVLLFTLVSYFISFGIGHFYMSWGVSHEVGSFFAIETPIAWGSAIALSSLTFFLSHYLIHGGIVRYSTTPSGEIKESCFTLKKPNVSSWLYPKKWAKSSLGGHSTAVFAGFMTVTLMFPYISLPLNLKAWTHLYLFRCIGAVMSALLLLRKSWPKKIQSYAPLWYAFTLWYTLPFLGWYTLWKDPNNDLMLVYLIAQGVMLSLIVGWRLFLTMQITACLGIALYGGITSSWPLFLSNIQPSTLYGLLLSLSYISLIYLFFGWKRSVKAATTIEGGHSTELEGLVTWEGESATEKKEEQPTPASLGHALGHSFSESTHLSHAPLHFERLTTSFLLDKVGEKMLEEWGEEAQEPVLEIDPLLAQQEVICDPRYISQLLSNGVRYFHEKYPERLVQVSVQEATLSCQLPAGSSASQVSALQVNLSVGKGAIESEEGCALALSSLQEVPLTLQQNQAIVEAHYGYAQLQETAHYGRQTYIIPRDVMQVKPRIISVSEEDLAEELPLNRSYDLPFLREVKKHSLPKDAITKALKRAKHYLGEKETAGVPVYAQALALGELMLPYAKDEKWVVASILLFPFTSSSYSLKQVRSVFGEEVAQFLEEYDDTKQQESLDQEMADMSLLWKEKKPFVLLLRVIESVYDLSREKEEKNKNLIVQQIRDVFLPLVEPLSLPNLNHMLQEKITMN